MHKRWVLVMALALLLSAGTALAERAQDITQLCLYNGSKGASIKDDSYRTVWESTRKNGIHALEIAAPEGQTIGGLLIRWRTWPLSLVWEAKDENGVWQSVGSCEADFLAQYIPVDGLPAVRLWDAGNAGNTKLQISSITVLTPGEAPADFQIWQKPSDKVDLMMLAAHPDDEVLWFGGMLPEYAGQRQKEVLVVNTSYAREDRRLELLDCLWNCGVKTYPVFLAYPDVCTNQRDRVLDRWEWDELLGDVVALYRRHRPDVVVLHDENGEYGHGVHRVISEAGRAAAEAAADPESYPRSAESEGTWYVPKVYMHLYPENAIQLNWHTPLECFDGQTAYEIAEQAFLCHRSQLNDWNMQSGMEYDNSLFGLWRSAVGEDMAKDDLFENIGAAR